MDSMLNNMIEKTIIITLDGKIEEKERALVTKVTTFTGLKIVVETAVVSKLIQQLLRTEPE